MGKVFLWVVVIVGMMLLTRMLTHHNAKQKHERHVNQAKKRAVSQSRDPEPMVRCAHCSIHLPRSEAVLSGGKTWCCTEHAKLGPRA